MWHPKVTTNTWNEEVNFNFEDMGLDPKLLKGMLSLVKPLVAQQPVIIPAMTGRDVVIEAPPGTGKTTSMLLSLLQRVDQEISDCQGIVLVPARQSIHVQEEVSRLGLNRITSFACVEGETFSKDRIAQLKCARVVIGTPAIIYDVVKRNLIHLGHLKTVVIDNANDLMSARLKNKVYKVFKRLPKHPQVVLATTSITPDVSEFIQSSMVDPEITSVKSNGRLVGVENYYVKVDTGPTSYLFMKTDELKIEAIVGLQSTIFITQAVIFCNSQEKVAKVAEELRAKQFTVSALCRGKQKEAPIQDFLSGMSRVMVTTDINNEQDFEVEKAFLVINYDLPPRCDKYIKRIGCGGQLGRRGVVINLVREQDELEALKEIFNFYGIVGKHLQIQSSESVKSHKLLNILEEEPEENLVPEEVPNEMNSVDVTQKLLDAMMGNGLKKPTSITKRALQPIVEGKNVIIETKSWGTMYACCFGILPLINRNERQCQALILVPVRDLASKIEASLLSARSHPNVTTHVCIGGTDLKKDKMKMEAGCQIVIGTTGRLLDMIKRKALKTDKIKTLVILNAESLYSKKHKEKNEQILDRLDSRKQVVITVETMSPKVMETVGNIMENYVVISKDGLPSSIDGVPQFYLKINSGDKLEVLVRIFDHLVNSPSVILCLKKEKAVALTRKLQKKRCAVATLYENPDKKEMEKGLAQFNAGTGIVLVTTDLKTDDENLRVKHVDIVICYGLPSKEVNYIHNRVLPGQLDCKSAIIYFVVEEQMNRLKELENFYNTNFKEMTF